MLPSVDFDNYSGIKTDEIHDVWTDGLLTFELMAAIAMRAQVRPQSIFRVGGVLA
jgi:hypothetical protein